MSDTPLCTGASVLRYPNSQNAYAVENMCMFDEEFERRLNSNTRLQSVFSEIMRPSYYVQQDQDESVQLAPLYIEHALLNRARFAMVQLAPLYIEHALLNRARFAIAQKYQLSLCYHHIPSQEMKQLVENLVNTECR
jgi:hypothetical protein